jgi:hypothetical protein
MSKIADRLKTIVRTAEREDLEPRQLVVLAYEAYWILKKEFPYAETTITLTKFEDEVGIMVSNAHYVFQILEAASNYHALYEE